MDIKEELRKYRMKYWYKETDEVSWTPLWQGEYCRWGKKQFAATTYGKAYVLWARVKWYMAGVYRPIKKTGSLIKGLRKYFATRQKIKASSKRLNAVVEEMRRHDEQYLKDRVEQYMYEPPTLEEVLEFQGWAKENGMNFHTRVQPMPKSIPQAPEIDLSAQSNVK